MRQKILYADDQPDMHKIISYTLSSQGYDVIHAEDGLEAWEKVQSERPELILLDYKMPKLTGDEVTKRIKADSRLCKIPVILMTASIESLAEEFLESTQADDYMFKPFDNKELENKIEKWLSATN